jgi:hypothetical protein
MRSRPGNRAGSRARGSNPYRRRHADHLHVAPLDSRSHTGEASARDQNEESQAPLGRLRLLVEGQLTLIRDLPAIPAILFSRELHGENRVLRGIFQVLMRRFNRRISKLFRTAQAEGALDPSDLGFLVMSIIQGVTLRWSIAGRDFDLIEGMRLFGLQLRLLGTAEGRRASS